MADVKLPYVTGYGNITKALQKIQEASTPDRFTQDFLSTKLGLKGGTPKPVIPFLKRTGFLGSDGAPTELYKRFRNPNEAGAAAFEALRRGYAPLFEMNEYVHDLNERDLKNLVVQITGNEERSSTTGAIVGSFKALRAFAALGPEAAVAANGSHENAELQPPAPTEQRNPLKAELSLGYTINLHLPATSDVAVFNAIFKSLRENLLS